MDDVPIASIIENPRRAVRIAIMNTPPPMPNVQFHVSINGAQAGPFTMPQLQQMAQNGQLTQQTYVWKQGMANWELAGNVSELAMLFAPPTPGTPPPPPPNV